jgi:hypothetical protein
MFNLKFKIVKKLKLFCVLALATGCVMMIGCSKGSTGPAGPAGPDSVTYTKWAPLSMTRLIGTQQDTSFEQIITAPAITSAVLSKGAVLGYLMAKNSNGDTLVVNSSTLMSEFFLVGKIDLYSGAVYAKSSARDYSGFNYRYVIIPGKISISSVSGQTFTVDQLKTMSYQEVSKLLNISSTGSTLKF